MELTKQNQSAGDNSTQIQAGVINNIYTIVNNGVGFPVSADNHHGEDIKESDSKRDYYFSYDKIRQYLRIARRVSRNGEYENLTTLDGLVLFLAHEWIGDYNEVEWRAFGITRDKLCKIAEDIAKPDEVVRVFSYLSDHAKEVLSEYARQEDVEAFERECDNIVRKTIEDNPSPIKGGYDENKPYLRMIALNMAKPYAEWEERDKIIFEHMDKPKDYAKINIFPFEAIYFAAESSLGLLLLLKQDKKEDVDIEAIIPNLRAGISMLSYRPVRTHREPIEQAMYVLSVLARDKARKVNGEPNKSHYMEISEMAISYVKEKFFKDISKNVINAAQALKEEILELSLEEQKKLPTDAVEEREHSAKWGKLFKYEELSNEELQEVVSNTCELIRVDKIPISFVEFVAAIISLCEIHDTLLPLPNDIIEGIQRNIHRCVQQCPNREELYELYTKFSQTIELLQRKAEGKTIHEMRDYFMKNYQETYDLRKDKMTLFLENMTDATMGDLASIYEGALPDHSKTYDMTGIFQNVDIDKMYAAICELSNASTGQLIKFSEDSYLLRYYLTGNSWIAFDEELIPLRKLKQQIDDNIEQFELNDKRSMRRLSEYVGMAIKRCCGETDVLIEY